MNNVRHIDAALVDREFAAHERRTEQLTAQAEIAPPLPDDFVSRSGRATSGINPASKGKLDRAIENS